MWMRCWGGIIKWIPGFIDAPQTQSYWSSDGNARYRCTITHECVLTGRQSQGKHVRFSITQEVGYCQVIMQFSWVSESLFISFDNKSDSLVYKSHFLHAAAGSSEPYKNCEGSIT